MKVLDNKNIIESFGIYTNPTWISRIDGGITIKEFCIEEYDNTILKTINVFTINENDVFYKDNSFLDKI